MLRRILRWLFAGSLPRLINHGSELGTITLTQVSLAGGLGWFCSIRAHTNSVRGQRYCWTGDGATMEMAIAEAIDNAKVYTIGGSTVMEHAPRLGGSENDG